MRILLAEDEQQMANAETAFLKMKGFDVDHAENGEAAVELAQRNAYDVMVLDIMMPVKDGIQALKEIRAMGNRTPVIMLTAKAEVDDRIDGLSAGADDYLTKPFALRELEARIKAQIRRTEIFSADVLSYGNIRLQIGEQELSGCSAVRLGGKETKLLEYLMRSPERAVSVEELFVHVWPEIAETDPDIAELYISYLKGKLQAVSADVEIRSDAGSVTLTAKELSH